MGWHFPVKFANLVAFITAPWTKQAPRLTKMELSEFLDSLLYSGPEAPLISSKPDWIYAVQHAAEESSRHLQSVEEAPWNDFVSTDAIATVIKPLKPLLGEYSLFGLAAGDCSHDPELRRFIERAAISSGRRGLFLIPVWEPGRYPSSQMLFDVIDPFPGFTRLAEEPGLWPGVIFWSKSHANAFAPLAEVEQLYSDLQSPLEKNDLEKLDKILKRYVPQRAEAKKILHLSDLHFGSEYTGKQEGFLSNHLESVAPKVNRIVITGDLVDNPESEDASRFRNFRDRLQHMTRNKEKDVIVIPGNHDQKWLGNNAGLLGRKLREVADLEWSNLAVDDDIETVFFCFDSAKDANFANGIVTQDQMVTIGTAFEKKCATNPRLRTYLSLALIHHHPFSFEEATNTFLSRYVGKIQEKFLKMHDAESFVIWCARKGVSAILHGHKHLARDAVKRLWYEHGTRQFYREVRAIGCGSSMGMDGGDLSYDLLTWDERSGKWGVSFFSSPPDGSGFVQEQVSLTVVQPAQ